MRLTLKNIRISTRIFMGFAFILFVVIAIIVVSNNNSNKIIASSNVISHTQKVITEIKDIEARLIDLETGQRGYIITGKLSYLEPYNKSLTIIDDKVNRLRELTSDNPGQTQRIDRLKDFISKKIDELGMTIKLREEIGFEAAKKVVVTNEGKNLMDSIRIQVDEIVEEEMQLLELRSLEPYEAKQKTFNILLTLLFTAIASIICIAAITSRSITRPVKTLQESTLIVGQGNLDHRLGIDTRDEIGQLSQSFEFMLTKLKEIMASKDILEHEIEVRKKTEQLLTKAKSELELSESKLIQSNKTKDKFFAIIAHDLKSPFTSMLGFSKLLNDQYNDLSEEVKKDFLKMIHANIESTYFLLENLLMWSQSQSGSIDFDSVERNLYLLSKNTMEVVHLSAQAKCIRIKNEIPQNIHIHVDENMFSTIMRNLLNNAIKFTHENGEIVLTSELIHHNGGTSSVEIKVKDNGVGISQEKQALIFDTLENNSTRGTANESGTGLGLLLCKEFIARHGGDIWVESEEGKGSTFTFSLPNAALA